MKQGIILKGLTNLSKRDKEDHTHEEEFIKKGEKSHCYGDGKSDEWADDIMERR
jgi:hypothetical protein